MSELGNYYRNFSVYSNNGELCRGEDCYGWHHSQVDTWHECFCNKGAEGKNNPHPEEYYYEEYEDGDVEDGEPIFEEEEIVEEYEDDDIPF